MKKKLFSIILVQSLIGISIGIAVAYAAVKDTVPGHTVIAAENVGGLPAVEAEKQVKDQLDALLRNGKIKIQVDGEATCEVRYRDLGVTVKMDETLQKVLGKEHIGDSLTCFITGDLAGQERQVVPVLSVDLQRMKEQLNDFAPALDKKPVNASVSLSGDTVKKIPETIGRKLNKEKAADTILRHLSSHLLEPVEFRVAAGMELEPSKPEYTLEDLKGVDGVISSYVTEIESGETLESIRLAVAAINQSIIPFDKGSSRGTFSFVSKLKCLNALQETEDEGYNQVASTLYAAVLTAGIEQKGIIRSPHSTTVDYIQPGLDARVFGDALDLQFRNSTGAPLVILAEARNGKVQISLAGKVLSGQKQSKLKVEVKNEITPPVIKVPSDQLAPGMEREISPGRAGLEVQVTRTRTGNNGETRIILCLI